jgi:chromosome segregation ATPase
VARHLLSGSVNAQISVLRQQYRQGALDHVMYEAALKKVVDELPDQARKVASFARQEKEMMAQIASTSFFEPFKTNLSLYVQETLLAAKKSQNLKTLVEVSSDLQGAVNRVIHISQALQAPLEGFESEFSRILSRSELVDEHKQLVEEKFDAVMKALIVLIIEDPKYKENFAPALRKLTREIKQLIADLKQKQTGG